MDNQNIKTIWDGLSKKDILKKYDDKINELKEYARQNNISESEIEEIFYESFESILNENKSDFTYNLFKNAMRILLAVILIYFILLHYNSTSSFMVRYMQTWIYPGFKLWRKLTIPVIKQFPALTEFYDESCLIRNPFYQMLQQDCTYCDNVKFIPDLTSLSHDFISEFQLPYIVKTMQSVITPQQLYLFYNENKKMFDENAPRVYSSNNSIQSLNLMMNSINKELHSYSKFVWRINRMVAGRTLRKIIKRPKIISNLGQSVERFIIIFGANASQSELPVTDCFNVFLLQVYGHRNIVLKPSSNCEMCKPLSVQMKPSYVLVYNRLQYKAISLPIQGNNIENISFMGSYC